MSAGRIVLLIFGILIVLVSFGLLAGGGVIRAVENGFKDNEGYYTTGMVPYSAASTALVTQPGDIQVDPMWFNMNRNPIALRAQATNQDAAKPIFIGIARESDLNGYLNGISRDEVTGFTGWPGNIEHVHIPGAATAPAPTSRNFWVASATGTGTQTLQWNVTSGRYALVVMNADGSSPVHGEVSLGVKVPEVVHGVGLGLLIGGIVLLVIGGVMIFFAARGW